MRAYANGIGINYELRGHGEPLTLIHALGLDLRQWQWQLPELSEGYRVLRYDVRGHGQTDSTSGPYDLETLAQDLHGLLASQGITRTHIVGLSMGGMIAQTFALAYPDQVASLVLADTASDYPPEARALFEARARAAETQGMAPLVEASIERWFTPDFRAKEPLAVEEIRQTLAHANPIGFAAACRAIAGLDLGARLGLLAAPTLVLVGDQDPGTPPAVAERIHERILGSRYEVIPDASHLTNVSNPRRFNELVRSFIGSTKR